MKKQIISVALIAVLGTVAVSCQKENITDWQGGIEAVDGLRTVSYTLNGEVFSVTLNGEEEWDAFMEGLMSLTEAGNEVRILSNSTSGHALKDTQVKKTPDRSEAKEWSKEKADEGYNVEMAYKDGEYICMATKNGN